MSKRYADFIDFPFGRGREALNGAFCALLFVGILIVVTIGIHLWR